MGVIMCAARLLPLLLAAVAAHAQCPPAGRCTTPASPPSRAHFNGVGPHVLRTELVCHVSARAPVVTSAVVAANESLSRALPPTVERSNGPAAGCFAYMLTAPFDLTWTTTVRMDVTAEGESSASFTQLATRCESYPDFGNPACGADGGCCDGTETWVAGTTALSIGDYGGERCDPALCCCVGGFGVADSGGGEYLLVVGGAAAGKCDAGTSSGKAYPDSFLSWGETKRFDLFDQSYTLLLDANKSVGTLVPSASTVSMCTSGGRGGGGSGGGVSEGVDAVAVVCIVLAIAAFLAATTYALCGEHAARAYRRVTSQD